MDMANRGKATLSIWIDWIPIAGRFTIVNSSRSGIGKWMFGITNKFQKYEDN